MKFFVLFAMITMMLYVSSWFVLRKMARVPLRVTFTPANTVCLIVTEEDNSGEGNRGGGNLVNALHAVPGMQLVKEGISDPMDWKFVDGEDAEHQNFLFQKLGIQDMGGWFYTTRTNVDRRMRFGWEKKDPAKNPADAPPETLHTTTKTLTAKHVFYSGELTVKIENADTADKLGLNFEIDFAFARKYPVRSILKLADATAFLTSRVHSFVNSRTSSQPAHYYYGGDGVGENREKLAKAIMDDGEKLLESIEKELGLDITMASIRDVDMPEAHRLLMEKQVTAEKIRAAEKTNAEGVAERDIILAQGRNAAGLLDNAVIADRINKLKEAAKDPNTLAVFKADIEATAYKENTTVTTFAPGSSTMVSP